MAGVVKRRIVVVCDGTWDRHRRAHAGGATNASIMWDALKAAGHPDENMVWDDGIGGQAQGWVKKLRGATGWGISKNVRDAYRGICKRYKEGDELWFFGFSRGAYTARSTVGMLRSCGIARDHSDDGVKEAYKEYRNRHHPECARAKKWREEHAAFKQVPVRFVGVWDTVGALGIPITGLRVLTAWRNNFHDVQLSRIVDEAYHAVAIDERRLPFRAALWSTDGPKKTLSESKQIVEQAWFPGVHRDVGGGYPRRNGWTGMSDSALAWMAGKARPDLKIKLPDDVEPDPLCTPLKAFRRSWNPFYPWRYIGDPRESPQRVSDEAHQRRGHAASGYAPRNLLRFIRDPSRQSWFRRPRGRRRDCRSSLRCRGINAPPGRGAADESQHGARTTRSP